MRRVSDVISMSSIRGFRVRQRVSPFKSNHVNSNNNHAPLSPAFLGENNNDFQPDQSLSPNPQHFNVGNGIAGSDTRAVSLPTTRGNEPDENASENSLPPLQQQQPKPRTSIDQAIDVSRLVRTVEELFRAVRLLFHPNYPTQFLPHQTRSPLPTEDDSRPSAATEEDAITILGQEVEEELAEMAMVAQAGLQHRLSIAESGSVFSAGSESDSIVVRNQPGALRDSMRKMQEVQQDGMAGVAAPPVTAPVDNFSPQFKKRTGGTKGAGNKENVINENAKEQQQQKLISSSKHSRRLPSYGELYARNQQFDCRYQPVQPILIENFASTFCNTCAYLFAALFVAIPIYLFLLLLLPFAGLVRLFQRLCCFEIRNTTRMTALETGFMSSLFAAEGVATSLIVLDTKNIAQPVAALQQALLSEIVNKRSNGKRIYQRFRQKPVRIACNLLGWRDDDQFAIERHFIANSRQRFSSIIELEEVLSDLSSQPLSQDKPLWEIRYVENFGGPGSILLICRHHLAVADGVSLVNVMHAAFSRNGRSPVLGQFDDWPPMHHLFTGSTYDFNVLRSSLVGPITVLAAHGVEPHPLNQAGVADPPESAEVDFDRYDLILSDPCNLDCLTVIKQITHSSLNEIFLSLLAGCIRCYLQNHAIANPPDLKALLPVNLSRTSYPEAGSVSRNTNPTSARSASQTEPLEFCPKLQNRYSFAFFKLPVSTEGAVSRLWAVRKRYENFSNASDTASIDSALRMADLVTAPQSFLSFSRQLFASGFCLVSNLAGSPCPLTIGGCQVSALMFWMPPPSGCNLSFSLFSYRNEVRLGVMVRSALMPRPKILTTEFTRQLQQLYEQVAVRTLSMELDTLFPDFTLSAMTQSTIQELEQLLMPIQTQLVQLKGQIDAGDRSLVTLQQIRRLQDRFRCLLIKIKQQQAIRNVAITTAQTTGSLPGSGKSKSQISEDSLVVPMPTSVHTAANSGSWLPKTPAARTAMATLKPRNSTGSLEPSDGPLIASPEKQGVVIRTQPLPPVYQQPLSNSTSQAALINKSQSNSAIRSTESMV